MNPRKWLEEPWFLFLLFLAASLIIYFPILHNSFVSDDFLVMKRIGLEKQIRIRGFFRPLSDLSLLLNYELGGFDPRAYYLFNILLHGTNSYLICRLCFSPQWSMAIKQQRVFAVIAGAFFLCYPFHSEGISWILGRGAMLANLFAVAALLVLASGVSEKTKIFWVCLCYFIGLAAYESILAFPLVILILLYGRRTGKALIGWISALGATLILHFIVRISFSGSLLGPYGETFLKKTLFHYAGNLFKVAGRLFLPPMESTTSMLAWSFAAAAGLGLIFFLLYRKLKQNGPAGSFLLRLIFMLGIACITPVLFGISTRTSESDRFLYFPSTFLCIGIAFFVATFCQTKKQLWIPVGLILGYYLFFLEKNNLNRRLASRITREIIRTIGNQKPGQKIAIVNLPDEYNGAYIFRLGLPEALDIYQLDPSRVRILNHLLWEQARILPDSILPETRGRDMFIPPTIRIRITDEDSSGRRQEQGIFYLDSAKESLMYWDKKKLVRLW